MPVQVKFGANTRELEDGVNRAKTALSDFTAPIAAVQSAAGDAADAIGNLSTTLGSLNDTISKGGAGGGSSSWLKTLLGGGIVVGATAGILDFLNKANQEMLDLEATARRVGLSLADFQSNRYGANISGVKNDQFGSGLDEAAKKLNDIRYGETEVSKLLDANGVKYKNQNGELVAMNAYLAIAADLIARGANEQERIKAASTLGFAKEWVPFLEQGSKGLEALRQKAYEAGAVLDDAIVHKDAEFARRWNEASAQWAAYFKGVLMGLTPALNTIVDALKNSLQLAKDLTAGVTEESLKNAGFVTADEAMENRRVVVGGLASVLKNDLNPQLQLLGRNLAALAGDTAAQRVKEGFKQVSDTAIDTGVRAVGWLDTVTGKAQAAYTALSAIINTPTGAPPGAVPGSGIKFPGGDKGQSTAVAEMQGAIAEAQRQYQIEVEQINSAAAMFRLTEKQKTADLVAAVNAREDAQAAAVKKAEADESLSEQQKQQLENRKTEIEQKATLDREKIRDAAAKKEIAAEEEVASKVAGAFSSQVSSILAGTETLTQAVQKAFASMVDQIVANLVKVAIELTLIKVLQMALGGGDALSGGGLAGSLVMAAFSGKLPGKAVGDWNVGSDTVAMLHKGEMVVPAQGGFADTLRAVLSGGGGGNSSSYQFGNINVSNYGRPLDPRQVADAMREAVRGGHISAAMA